MFFKNDLEHTQMGLRVKEFVGLPNLGVPKLCHSLLGDINFWRSTKLGKEIFRVHFFFVWQFIFAGH
jgi:hypothetical protein